MGLMNSNKIAFEDQFAILPTGGSASQQNGGTFDRKMWESVDVLIWREI